MARGSEESHWNRVQMLITTQAGNLQLQLLFNWIIWKLFERIHAKVLQVAKLRIYKIIILPPVLSSSFVAWQLQKHKQNNGVESDTLVVHRQRQCTVNDPVHLTAGQPPHLYEQWRTTPKSPAPPGPSRRWRREYHTLLVSCKGNYCWLKLLNICLLAPQSTL